MHFPGGFGERHSCKSKAITGDLSRALLWVEILPKTSPVETGIIENIEGVLELPFLVRSVVFFFSFQLPGRGLKERIFSVFLSLVQG